jgi:RNA polymerase sigma-70 factor, ECF subfamily
MEMDSDRLVRVLLAQRGMLLAYIMSIVRDIHLAEDVFQDASLIILKKGAVLKSEAEFGPWARGVARLEALSALRKKSASPRCLEPELLDLLDHEWNKENPSESATLAVRRCIEQLPEKARRLIELRYVAELSGVALAERLNQPPNTIYVTLSRIYRVLSKCVLERLALEG